MRAKRFGLPSLAVMAAFWLAASPLFGLTLDQLRHDPKLTPHRFARYFSHFKFEFHAGVQAPDIFLARQAGDCDDYATLAAAVLRERGYTPRLITVRMAAVVHVICYVADTRSYLDYNNRDRLFCTVRCGPGLEEIARKVSRSFDTPWLSASEFEYRNGTKVLVATVRSTSLAAAPAAPCAVPMQLAETTHLAPGPGGGF